MDVALKSHAPAATILENPDTADLFNTLEVIIVTSASAAEVLVTPTSMQAAASLVLALATEMAPRSISDAAGVQEPRKQAAVRDRERSLAAIVSTIVAMGWAARELQFAPESLRPLRDRKVAGWLTSILRQAIEDPERLAQDSDLVQACCRFIGTVHADSWELYSPQGRDWRLHVHPVALCVAFIRRFSLAVEGAKDGAKLNRGTTGGAKPLLTKFADVLGGSIGAEGVAHAISMCRA
ncbi:hypothetical protein WJX72_006004 [[Myrmecia] bisecta]|uniref:Uncharacterized protein n=1 Tax=[Myrmecia] bisecta TaxID=41462 RepID=A0AAW1R6S7_9CHLO